MVSSSGVTIDIKQDVPEGEQKDSTTYPGGFPNKVKLTKEENPQHSGFLKYTHIKSDIDNGGSFKVKEVQYGPDVPAVDVDVNGKNIRHLSVWYWKSDNGMTNPLLMEVWDEYKIYTYYYNKGGGSSSTINWQLLPGNAYSKIPLQNVNIERTLDNLNCKHNSAVVIDLTRSNSKKYAGSITKYCCTYHNPSVHNNQGKVTVGRIQVSCKHQNSFTAYKHAITSGKLAGIRFYQDGVSNYPKNRRRIKFSSYDVQAVYAFYCNKGDDPVLIYIDYNHSENKNDEWFKQPTISNGNNEEWTEVNELKDITPERFSKLECDEWNALVKVLKKVEVKGLKECSRASLVVDIYKRGTSSIQTFYPHRYSGSNRILVTGFRDNQEGFTEYQHTSSEIGSFTVKEFQYNGKPIKGDLNGPMNKVTSVSVFYWTPLETLPSRKSESQPLLVKVTKKSGRSFWYENKGDSEGKKWKVWQMAMVSDQNIQKKLYLLNCVLNNAVVIDVTVKRDGNTLKTYDACKDKTFDTPHGENKMEVTKDTSGDKLGGYEVHIHKLKEPPDKKLFHIVGFKNGTNPINIGEIPSSPILDVDKVGIYFCSKDRDNIPLLIYYHKDSSVGGSPEHNWYKNNGTWKKLQHDTFLSSTTSYRRILGVLDELESKCKPPAVTIDISQKDTVRGYKSPDKLPEKITVSQQKGTTPGSDPPLNYDLYEHTVVSRPNSYFILEKLVCGNTITLNGRTSTPVEQVTSVSVYYWSHLNTGRPLMLKITQTRSKSNPLSHTLNIWFENADGDDTKWTLVTKPSQAELAGTTLEKKLYLLNCKLNNAVKINVGVTPGETSGNEKEYDSCSPGDINTLDPGTSSHGKRLKVTNQTPKGGEFSNYKAYEHTALSTKPFHIVGFEGATGVTTPITLGGFGSESNPLTNIQKLIVYACRDNHTKPLLIYYKIGGSHNWYKNNDNGKSEWTSAGLYGDPNNHSQIPGVHSTLKGKCNPTSSPTDQSIQLSSQVEIEDHPQREAIASAPASIFATIAGYFFAGTAGSGLAGFTGYKLVQRFKGDPWVRQI